MEIRPALPADAPALTALGLRLFQETYAGRIPAEAIAQYVGGAFRPEVQLAELQITGGCVLIAVEGSELRAYAQLRPAPAPATLEVARFYVDSPWHGQGLAAQLMAACRAWAGPRGYRHLCLQVWEDNPRAIRFYLKQTFLDAGATTFQVGPIVYRDRLMRADLPDHAAPDGQ